MSGPADLAREALARAKADAAARQREVDRAAAGERRRANRKPRGRPGRESGGEDPVAFGSAISAWVEANGYAESVSVARVMGDWEGLVGPAVAAHARPTGLTDGRLVVQADSTAWATQLRLLEPTVLASLRAALGSELVTGLTVHGPTGPSWKKGAWSVPGRGPRDTYG